MKTLTNALLLTLALTAVALAGSWQTELAVADKLLESGYYEAAVEDYQKLVTTYSGQAPVVDRAWFGMARAYHAQGNTSAAKVSLEKCLERDQDVEATTGARQLYRQLKDEARLQAQQTEQAVQFFEARYYSTSWLNIITKLFDYFDLRKARKELTTASEYDGSFNPRYLIDPVALPANQDAAGTGAERTFTLTAEEMDALLQKLQTGTGTATEDATAAVGADDEVQPTVETPAATAAPAELSANPHADLKERRDAYLAAYRVLQDALRGQNQQEIQRANDAFQAAQRAYVQAQQAVAALQNP